MSSDFFSRDPLEGVRNDRDEKKILPHQEGVSRFTKNKRRHKGSDPQGTVLCENCKLPQQHGLDETGYGDKEAVTEVEVPVAMGKAAKAETMQLHGCDQGHFFWTVSRNIRHKK